MSQPSTDTQASTTRHVEVGLIASIVAIGLFLRSVELFHNPAFTGDEARLAESFLTRTLVTPFTPLLHDQAAPWLFTTIETALSRIFGPSEWTLKSLPFAGAALALVGMALTRPRVGLVAAITALLFFVFSDQAIHYAAVFKPYALDAGVAALWLAAVTRTAAISTGTAVGWAIFGVFSLWLSYPAVFVLGGVGLYGWSCARTFPDRKKLVAVGVVWAGAFFLHYALWFKQPMSADWLVQSFDRSFLAFPPSFDALTSSTFSYLGAFSLPAMAMALAVVGCARSFARRDGVALVVVASFGLAVMASWLRKYPFNGRLLMFAAPGLCLLVGSGLAALWSVHRLGRTIALALAAFLLAVPVKRTPEILTNRTPHDGVRDLLSQVANRDAKCGALYVHPAALAHFNYYRARFEFPPIPMKVAKWTGNDPNLFRDTMREELQELPDIGNRALCVLTTTNASPKFRLDEHQAAAREVLETMGKPVGARVSYRAQLMRYQMTH